LPSLKSLSPRKKRVRKDKTEQDIKNENNLRENIIVWKDGIVDPAKEKIKLKGKLNLL